MCFYKASNYDLIDFTAVASHSILVHCFCRFCFETPSASMPSPRFGGNWTAWCAKVWALSARMSCRPPKVGEGGSP